MPTIFDKLDKIKPIYDMIYKVILFICKILLILDIAITSMAVAGRYISFIPDPSWSEEVVLTFMAYMAVLFRCFSNPQRRSYPYDRTGTTTFQKP